MKYCYSLALLLHLALTVCIAHSETPITPPHDTVVAHSETPITPAHDTVVAHSETPIIPPDETVTSETSSKSTSDTKTLNKIKKNKKKCDLYLAPLKHQREQSFRTAVYAGRNFRKAELIEITNSLLLKREVIEEWQLYDYSFETENNDYEMHLFGASMLFSQKDFGNVHHFWTNEPSEVPLSPPNPFSDYETVSFYSERKISQGEELILISNVIDESESADNEYEPYSIDELQRVGHCLTDIYLDDSEISQAGKGVFSSTKIKKGEIATISPMFVLPRHKIEKQNSNSLLINYCISRNDSDMALLPVGLAGMINHNSGGSEGEVANLRMEWHSWDTPGGRAKVRWEAQALESLDSPPLFIRYVAEHDIYPGDELTISYGEDWEAAWKAYDKAAREVECSAEGSKISEKSLSEEPQFRHFITAPEGLFPPNFVSTCIGKNKNDCAILEAKRRLTYDTTMQAKYNAGPELVASYREKLFSKQQNPSEISKSNNKIGWKMDKGAADVDPAVCKRRSEPVPLTYSKISPPSTDFEEL